MVQVLWNNRNLCRRDEDGPFYKSVQWEILSKWSADKAAQKKSIMATPNEAENSRQAAPSTSECTDGKTQSVSHNADDVPRNKGTSN